MQKPVVAEPWINEVFEIATKLVAGKWMNARKATIKKRNEMRAELNKKGVYHGSATAHEMLKMLEEELHTYATGIIDTVRELLDASTKPLTKDQEQEVTDFCVDRFGSLQKVGGPASLFDEEMKLAYRGQQASSASQAAREKLKAAKGSALSQLKDDLLRYLYVRRQKFESGEAGQVADETEQPPDPDPTRKRYVNFAIAVALILLVLAVIGGYVRLKTDYFEAEPVAVETQGQSERASDSAESGSLSRVVGDLKIVRATVQFSNAQYTWDLPIGTGVYLPCDDGECAVYSSANKIVLHRVVRASNIYYPDEECFFMVDIENPLGPAKENAEELEWTGRHACTRESAHLGHEPGPVFTLRIHEKRVPTRIY